ncbi:carboxypeptidase-like protein [Pontibacter ummariensis]|uniref:CarboxypepD_reg-like domain-containing protein n=1 Tax=Pontibacter ummariensis TaxID=1610492 RepID=A0A239JCS2_9BACT|nr:carboxypeptidase-like protein [Pontibacter ummariensis]SNT03645.1 CarboxypepD_reg-like domain-containing protein [Pontibacter ummariensis]
MYSSRNIYKLYINGLLLSLLLVVSGVNATAVMAQGAVTTVKGTVRDAVSNEALIGVSVFVPGTSIGTSTDFEGNYLIKTNQPINKVQFSYLGYETVTLGVSPGQEQTLDVKLKTGAKQLSEVVVVGKKRKVKYSNKNNPAVDLIREIVDHKEQNRPEHYDYVQYEEYEKTQMSLVNTPEKLKRNIFLRKYDFITSNLDTTVLEGKALLPFFVQEQLAEHYYRKAPETRKTIVKAEKKVDFGEFIDNKGFTSYMQHMYQDIDIYDNNITILTNQFLSPIADMAPTFYKFYLTDTVTTESGRKLAELRFEPRNPAAFMFTGKLLVTIDGTYAVQSVEMEVAKSVSINWVRDLKINLDFEKNPDGRYHLSKSVIKTDFGLTQNSDAGMYGERVVSYKDFKVNEPQPASLYEGEAVVRVESAIAKDESFWQASRHDSLTAVEAKTYTNIDSLVNMKSFQRTMDWATALIAGYKRLGPNIEIGPLNTFYSFNPVEGFRLRFGGRTTTTFSKKYMLETYAAYGFKDEKWKYYLGGSYSLTDRSIYEFPVRSISASYQKDTNIPGQELQFVQEDNFLLSFKRGENDKWLYNETYSLNYLHEFENHFSYRIGFKNWRQATAGSLQYVRNVETASGEMEPLDVQNLVTSEASLELRWAPNEQFFQGKLYRTPVANRYPVFTLRAAAGIKDLFDSEYEYQKVALNVYKRFYMSQLGYSDVVTEGGYTFGQVPFPLLMIHRANQTYSYQLQSYNLMNFLEFVSDQYASVHIDHTFNGFIFNKIPLLKKTKLREFVTFKALYGKVRSENMPQGDPDLLRFPTFDDGRQATYTLENKPYMEASVGIGNIFNFFRVDLVKRLSYLDHPNVSDIGIRGRFKFDF